MSKLTLSSGDVDESYIHSIFWEWLKKQSEYIQIGNEITLGDSGQIDLVAETDTEEYAGFEMKVNPSYTGYKTDQIVKQIPKYKESGYLDRLYLVGVDNKGYDYLDTFLSDPDRFADVGVIELGFEIDSEPPLPTLSESDVEIHREAEKINRMEAPQLTRRNEAWVQHHIWKEFGDLKEGKLPNKNAKTELQIDIIRFEGGDHPVDIFSNSGEIIGIEVKDGKLNRSRGRKICRQLDSYVHSGGLSQIYLAVPDHAKDSAIGLFQSDIPNSINVQSHIGSDIFNVTGLLTVDESGAVKAVRNAKKFELKHDGYRTDSGSDYLRTMGYGKLYVRPPQSYHSIYEMEPVERPEAKTPPLESISQDDYEEPAVWPAELVAKIQADESLSKSDRIWKHILERRELLYKNYVEGTKWTEITPHEKAHLAVQTDTLSEKLQFDVSQEYIRDTLEEMAKHGYLRKTQGKGAWVPGVDGRVKFFISPLRIVLPNQSNK